jgi:hypothetical protein
MTSGRAGGLKNVDHLQINGSNILRRPDKGAEGKTDCAASIGGISASHKPLLAFRKAERGRGKKASMKGLNTPATAKEGYLPHDCKQYGFPSATLKSLDIRPPGPPHPAESQVEFLDRSFSQPMLSMRSALALEPRPKWEHRRNFPERLNFGSPPAEPGVYQKEINF